MHIDEVSSIVNFIVMEHKTIKELFTRYVVYWNSHDMENWGRLFTDNTKFVTWSGVVYNNNSENVEQHRRAHQVLLKENQNMTYDLTILNICTISDGVAVIHARWTWKDFRIDNSHTELRSGILTMVLVKENGTWLIHTTQNTRTWEHLE